MNGVIEKVKSIRKRIVKAYDKRVRGENRRKNMWLKLGFK